MPEPLSKVLKIGEKGAIHPDTVILSPEAISKLPYLSLLVTRAIAARSQSDFLFGAALISILGAQAAPAFAMYEVVRWSYAKTQALKGECLPRARHTSA